MPQYLLSTHTAEGSPRATRSAEEMQEFMDRITTLESDMRSSGAWVFSGRLHPPDTATVVKVADGEIITTDGPFAESKEHLAGFYIIAADDLDAALSWASKVTAAIDKPIEVWPMWEPPAG